VPYCDTYTGLPLKNFLISVEICDYCIFETPNTVLNKILYFQNIKAGGSAVPPCLLGVRRGTSRICCGSGFGARGGLCGMRTGPGTGLRTGVRDWRTDPAPDPRAEPSPWSSYRAALLTGWWIRIFI